MKILYQSRIDLYDPKGGDTIQMEKTKNAVEKIDPSIKIDIVTDLKAKNINDYDLVHLFNLDWVCETYLQALWAKQHGKKIVLSAIHHSEDEVKLYESKYKFDIRRIYNLVFTSQPLRDEWKNIYRSIFNIKKLYPTIIQILGGIRNLQRDILTLSDAVLVQTEKEAEDIEKDFGFKVENWHKIVNGVDVDVFKNADNSKFIDLVKQKSGVNLDGKKIILNVGRIEPRKNQLSLIQAFKNLKKRHYLDDYYLVFIGAFSKYSPEYKLRFNWNLKSKKSQIIYLGPQPHNYVASAMSHPGIYVHPSWFETTGLVALEALVSGMKVVISGDRAKEYLGELADYCNPDNIRSIEYAILEAVKRQSPSQQQVEDISKSYNWDETAKQTIKVYKELFEK